MRLDSTPWTHGRPKIERATDFAGAYLFLLFRSYLWRNNGVLVGVGAYNNVWLCAI